MSKSEKDKYHRMSLLCGIYNATRTQLSNRTTDTQNQAVVAEGKGAGGELEWEAGVSRYKLLYIEWIHNKVLL